MKSKINLDFLVVSSKPFNTNNAWGFGGSRGFETIYANGLKNRKGSADYRHMPSTSFDNWYVLNKEDNEYYRIKRCPKKGEAVRIIKTEDSYKTVIEDYSPISLTQIIEV